MILTTCPACAAPLAHDAPRCVRCKLRYCKCPVWKSNLRRVVARRPPRHRRDACSMAWRCNATCQHDHWRRGHKQMCKKIHRGGNAEQYHADKKYKEAVAEAVEACADDTKGQTCYICTQALHWKTKEGLVRMCACRGTAGFAHVSCLAEQAKILCDEAEENNLDNTSVERFRRWLTCSLCEQDYHGVVRCALGWACWKTYVGRPEGNWARGNAMNTLGNGLFVAEHYDEALSVREAELATRRRCGAPEATILGIQSNLASTYSQLGRLEPALRMRRDVYSGCLSLSRGSSDKDLGASSIGAANNLADALMKLRHDDEALPLLLETIPKSQLVLGKDHDITFKLQRMHAQILCEKEGASHDDLTLAVVMLEDIDRRQRRTLGPNHPQRKMTQACLELARGKQASAHAL